MPLTGDNEIRGASANTRLFVSSSVKHRALAHALPQTGSLRKKKITIWERKKIKKGEEKETSEITVRIKAKKNTNKTDS